MAKADSHRRPDGELTDRPRPNFERRLFFPNTLAAIVAELTQQGIAASAALEGTGLAPSELDAHTTRTSYRQLDVVVRNALRLSNDPAIALRAGLRMHVTAYGMYGYALLSSATLAEAGKFGVRYIRVIGPFCDVELSENAPTAIVTLKPLHWPNVAEATHRFAVEFALSAHLTTNRDRAGNAFKFSRVALDYATPPYASVYESLFECPVVFGQKRCRYEHDFNDGPMAFADPRTNAMVREMCDDLLSEVNRAGSLTAEVRRILVERPGRNLSISAIAEKLGTSTRLLRRTLDSEGTSYRGIRAEVRTRLAIEYLRTTRMSYEEIANRVGYSDGANFRHAFMRWTGKSPSDFRGNMREHRQSGAQKFCFPNGTQTA